MYGDCASCGFPVSFEGFDEPVACPYCRTINQAISDSITPIVILGIVLGVLVLAKSKVTK